MSDFEKWFGVRFPNIQATIDQTNDQESKLLKISCKEVWQHQQAIINDLRSQLNNVEQCYIGVKKECEGLQKELSTTKQVLHNVIDMERNKKEDLQKRVDEAELQIAVYWGADEDTDSVLKDIDKALRGEHE